MNTQFSNIGYQVNTLQQRCTVIQSQLNDIIARTRIMDSWNPRLCKLEEDLKATTAVVMMLRKRLLKSDYGDIDIKALEASIKQLISLVKDPSSSIYMTKAPTVLKPDGNYEINHNAGMSWDTTDPEKPILSFTDKDGNGMILIDPNDQAIKIDDSVEVSKDKITSLMTIPDTEPPITKEIVLIKSSDLIPNELEEGQSLFDYLNKEAKNDGLEKEDPCSVSDRTIGWKTFYSDPEKTERIDRGVDTQTFLSDVIYFKDYTSYDKSSGAVTENGAYDTLNYKDVVQLKRKFDSYSSLSIDETGSVTTNYPGLEWTTNNNNPQITFVEESSETKTYLPIISKGDINSLDAIEFLDIDKTTTTSPSLLVQISSGVQNALDQSSDTKQVLNDLIDLIVNGEKYYNETSGYVEYIVPERYGTTSMCGIMMSNNDKGQLSSMPAVAFVVGDDGKINGYYELELDDHGELVPESGSVPPYKKISDLQSDFNKFIFANIYNRRTNREKQ